MKPVSILEGMSSYPMLLWLLRMKVAEDEGHFRGLLLTLSSPPEAAAMAAAAKGLCCCQVLTGRRGLACVDCQQVFRSFISVEGERSGGATGEGLPLKEEVGEAAAVESGPCR